MKITCAALAVAGSVGAAAAGALLLPLHALAQTVAPTDSAAAPAAEEDRYRFDILEYEVSGNSVLPAALIEQAVMPFMGPGKRMADVEAARTALEKVYQSQGFLSVFVDVPEQQVTDGLVRLQVIEGKVDRVMVTGSRYFSHGYIRSKITALTEGQVPNFNDVQQQLVALNRTPDRRVQPVLRPGKLPGTVEAELKVDDKLPFSGSVELHNQHAVDTDPLRLAVGLRYGNLFQRDHSLALNAIVAPRAIDQARIFVLNYAIPEDDGDTWAFTAVNSDSSVASLGGVNVLGKGTTFSLRYITPLGVARDGSWHSLSLGADLKHLQQQVKVGNDTLATPLRYLPFQMAYNGVWPASTGPGSSLNATFTMAQRKILQRDLNVDFCAGSQDQFACNKYGGDGSFATLRLDWRHSEPLPARTSLGLRLAGQYANQPLVSAEQFAMGGAETVRGYLESSALGDTGWLGSLELRSPNWAGQINPAGATAQTAWVQDLTVFAFVDAAQVRLSEPLPGQSASDMLMGTGLGLRLTGRYGLSLALDLARPTKTTASVTTKDTRLHARLGWKF